MGGDATFGQRLRAERVAAGMSQRELARASEMSQSMVMHLEAGRRTVKLDAVASLATALGVAVPDLLTPAEIFEVEFHVGQVERTTPPPWMERRLLALLAEPDRVAAWPYLGDGAFRLRARASSLPDIGAIVGRRVEGVSLSLPPPTFRPVQPSRSLLVLLRAPTKTAARSDLAARIAKAECSPRVKFERFAGLWRARLRHVPKDASMVLQGIVRGSPIGMFVPI